MLLVSGWFSFSKTIIPEAGSTFSSHYHDATLISSVDWGLGEAKDANLPSDIRLLARRDGFSVLYIPLDDADDSQVQTATAASAAKTIGDPITDEPLLLLTKPGPAISRS